MDWKRLITAGMMGTTAMTAFSYLVSDQKKKNFKEPEVLGEMADHLIPGHHEGATQVAGWNAHYLVGFIFNGLYEQIWKRTSLKPTIANGLLVGAVSGVAGVLVWKQVFRMHPDPPQVNLNKYYKHLIVAHLIFGVGSVLGYRIPKSE